MGLGLTAMAACSSDAPPIDPDEVPPQAVFQRPGFRAVTGAQAVTFFRDVCVNTAPDFARLPAVLATMPVTQNTRSGTYYHRRFDMSAKLTPAGCSVVAGGSITAQDARAAEALSERVTARAPIPFEGRNYLSATFQTGPGAR